MAAAQAPCCSGVDVSPGSAPARHQRSEGAGWSGLGDVPDRWDGCSCEGQMVEKRVKALKGVKSFSLNSITNQMKLTYDPSALSVQDIETAVKKAGAKAVLVS